MHGVREIDGPERVALDLGGVHRVERRRSWRDSRSSCTSTSTCWTPSIFPAQFPVDGGLTASELRAFLAEAAAACTIIGAEITSAAPDCGELVVDAITPLLA